MKRIRAVGALLLALLAPAALSSPPAQAAPGDGPAVGFDYLHIWMGSLTVAGETGYCIDQNGDIPRKISGWSDIGLDGQRKQEGRHPNAGISSNTGPIITDEEWARIAFVLEAAQPHASDPVWTAVADRMIRLTSISGPEQAAFEDQRWAQLLHEHPEASSIADQLAADQVRLAGPYTLTLSWIKQPTLTEAGSVAAAVTTARGERVDRPITVTVDGAQVTAKDGLITVPAGPGKHTVSAASHGPAIRPRLRVPQHYFENHPDRHGQRNVLLGVPQALSATLDSAVDKAKPTLTTTTSHQSAAPGTAITDRVLVKNSAGYRGTGTAILWGPYPSQPGKDNCRVGDAKAGEVTFEIAGDGNYTTPAITVTKPGYYVWQEVLPESPTSHRVVTPCGVVEETSHVVAPPPTATTPVRATPAVPTQTASAQPLIRAGLGNSSASNGWPWLVALVITGTGLVVFLVRRLR